MGKNVSLEILDRSRKERTHALQARGRKLWWTWTARSLLQPQTWTFDLMMGDTTLANAESYQSMLKAAPFYE